MINLTFPFPPSPYRYWSRDSRSRLDYRREIKAEARKAGVEPLTGEVHLSITFFCQGEIKRGNHLPDCFDMLSDAMKTVLYRDESQIRGFEVRRVVSAETKVAVSVREVI